LKPLPHRLCVVAGEEAPVRQSLPKHDADRKHVGARIRDRAGLELLGSEVAHALRIAVPRLAGGRRCRRADVEELHVPSSIDEYAVRMHAAEPVFGRRRRRVRVECLKLNEQAPGDSEEQRRFSRYVL